MYRSRLLRWAGVALTVFTLLGTFTYSSISANSAVLVAEDPKVNGGG